MRNRLFRENQAKDCQEIENLRRIDCEEFVAKKPIEQDKQQLMNCLCVKRGILRLRVNYWLRFGIYKTK